ncbi:MAG: hypothetical protein NPIRA02_03580 [Nitrospirales bacterium]|nr:MAG: hypothetical protein NPIRA02_03580 [Nitrospirales bacterium]
MSEDPQRRECTRVALKHVVELHSGDRVPIQGVLCNLSLKGLYVRCHQHLPLHADCHVTLLLNEGEGEPCVYATGIVVRVDETGLAIEFTNILGEESLMHLRNLVRFNSHDCLPYVEQEFREHLGLRGKG